MNDDSRSIELEIEVPGTREQVWQAIATGPGITSWYVPHIVEEREGGASSASFGPGPEMQIAGRVAVWQPPERIVFDGGEDVDGLAFEWLVEARNGGTCVVRLVNSGFGNGDEWDSQYDAMTEGWKVFLVNLRLHLTHFAGQEAVASLPTTIWPGPSAAAWAKLMSALGIATDARPGDRLDVNGPDAPRLGGTVADVGPTRISLVVDDPVPGTALIAVETMGDVAQVSVWSYLYGAEAAAAIERDEVRWSSLLDDLA